MKRIAFFLVLTASLVANCWVLVKLLDAGLVIDNARNRSDRLDERANQAIVMLRKAWISQSQSSVAGVVQEFERRGWIVGQDGPDIEMGDLLLESHEGIITRIDYID